MLIFLSGAEQIPVLKQPTIIFQEAILATTSTYDLQLRLPTMHGNNYDEFKESLILSIVCNDGFGMVCLFLEYF